MQTKEEKRGIIVNCLRVKIKEEPDDNSESIGSVNALDVIIVSEIYGKWTKVKKGNVVGYIPNKYIVEVDT